MSVWECEDSAVPLQLIYDDASVEVHQIVVGPVENNVNIVRCKRTGEGLLIDAANEHERLLELCQRFGVTQVLETHGHWDHIQAVESLREAGISVAVTAQDAAMLPSYDLTIDDDVAVTVGDLTLTTIWTPGHTAGSICFALHDTPLLFTGDTLFPGGPGNTFGDAAAFTQILASIDERLFRQFKSDTIVLPGHGAATTLGVERPHLEEWAARGW
jgi:glyoxylase-like metal-dependent hydrolase (beta-lactamase superfamily II)